MTTERRRFPGAVSYLWCRTCKEKFTVAGRRRERVETPVIELIVCPQCRAIRRMVLPVNVGLPFRVLSGTDRLREK
jgi:uncharacterized protein YbaR (Trm112 family)